MKKWLKYLSIIGLLIALAGASFVIYVYNKPHRDVAKETAITITAQKIFDDFKANEAEANKLYLDKAVQISGEVANVSVNQAGKSVVDIKTNDPLFFINFTFKENPRSIKSGETITIKGICTGYIPDANVVVNEGVLVK